MRNTFYAPEQDKMKIDSVAFCCWTAWSAAMCTAGMSSTQLSGGVPARPDWSLLSSL